MKAASRMKSAAHRMREKPIEMRTLEDGTLEVRTTDADPYLAEARAADDVRLAQVLADFRRRGHQRPVRLVLCHESHQALRALSWLKVPATAVPLHLRCDHLTGFVLTAADARRVLRPQFGWKVNRLFLAPCWPVSFWEVHVMASRTQIYESRTWQDIRATR